MHRRCSPPTSREQLVDQPGIGLVALVEGRHRAVEDHHMVDAPAQAPRRLRRLGPRGAAEERLIQSLGGNCGVVQQRPDPLRGERHVGPPHPGVPERIHARHWPPPPSSRPSRPRRSPSCPGCSRSRAPARSSPETAGTSIGARHRVVHEAGGQKLAGLVVDDLFRSAPGPAPARPRHGPGPSPASG